MNNERIEKILNDHLWMGSEPSAAQDSIINAMEQYALETSKDGFCAGSDAVHKLLRPEIDRLQALVQAQKELIECLNDGRGFKNWQIAQLRNKIKSLEK